MLINLLLQHPQMLSGVLKATPTWVWALLTGLIALGLSQVRDRNASLARITILPVAMIGLSVWGTVSAFGPSPLFGEVILAWLAGAVTTFSLLAASRAPSGTRYDAATRTYWLPGSWIPMALILGVFFTRYVVNVDVAMNPGLVRDGVYTLAAGALYGLFSGIFAGRAARLWLLAHRTASPAVPAHA